MHHRPVRLSWARLLKRVFEIELEHCPNCGGELKIIAAILEPPVIERILEHPELPARVPPRSPGPRPDVASGLTGPLAGARTSPPKRPDFNGGRAGRRPEFPGRLSAA